MAIEKVSNFGKGSLPFIIASILCGYMTNYIPTIFPNGELRDWAYRAIPCLSVCILFAMRVLCDLGTMSFSELVFSHFCATPEKKKLQEMMNDPNLSELNKDKAKNRYNEIVSSQIDINSRRLNYCFGWIKKPSPPAQTPDPKEE